MASRVDGERIAAIGNHERAVLVFGPDAFAGDVVASLDALALQAPKTVCTNIVLAPKERIADFQELIDADRLFYLSRGALRERDLAALIESAFSSQRPDVSLDRYPAANDLRRMALAQSVSELADALRSAVGNAIEAERIRCVLFDGQRQVLWAPNESDEGESPAVGLVSFIQRTGMTVCLPRLGDDPRFDLDVDNPFGESSDRFLGVPIRAGRGVTMAVLVALRPVEEPPFEPLEIAEMEAIAAHAGPYVASWLVEPADANGPFRPSALRALDQPITGGPEPLRLEAKWMRRAPWLAIAALGALVLALAFVRVPEYATGSAIVRNDGAVVATFSDLDPLLIHPGMLLRFNQQSLAIESVQHRGAQTIVVTERLPRNHAGSRGKAEVRVGSVQLLFSLVPCNGGSWCTWLGLDRVSFVEPPQHSPAMPASARLAHTADPYAICTRFHRYTALAPTTARKFAFREVSFARRLKGSEAQRLRGSEAQRGTTAASLKTLRLCASAPLRLSPVRPMSGHHV